MSERLRNRLVDRSAHGSTPATQPATTSTPAPPASASPLAANSRTPLDPTHFSTPHDGAAKNADGSYRVATIQGVNVDLRPDVRDTSVGEKAAETRIIPNYVGVHWGQSVNGRPNSVTLPSLSLAIETHYGPNASPDSPSGYGRGTTEEDKQAGNTSLGFHEGTHGTAAQQYLRDHPLPVFEGKQGMTVARLQTLGEQHKAAVTEYVRQMTEEVRRQGDCVGTPAGFCAPGQQPSDAPAPSPGPAPAPTPDAR